MKKFGVLIVLGVLGILAMEWHAEAQVSKLMAQKLKSAQAILEGIALADFKKISKNAEELVQLTKKEEWHMIKQPRYEMFSNEFRRANENLIQKAADKNIDAAALAYMELTLTCVRCHQYVRDLRDVKADQGVP
jgi:hypothetical protein